MLKKVEDLKPCFIGLEPFLYPKKIGDQKKRNERLLKRVEKHDIMIKYYCFLHDMYFWRDIIEKKGKCSLCKSFIPKIHYTTNSKRYITEVNQMVEVKKAIKIEDGKYNGTIKNIVERTEPYEYTDFIIDVKTPDGSVELKYGCPTGISLDKDGNPTTKLTKVLTAFGMEFKIGDDITTEKMKEAVVGKKASMLIETNTTKEGTFANITSLKPA